MRWLAALACAVALWAASKPAPPPAAAPKPAPSLAPILGVWTGGHECGGFRTRLRLSIRRAKAGGVADWSATTVDAEHPKGRRMSRRADLTPADKPGLYTLLSAVPKETPMARIFRKAKLHGFLQAGPDGKTFRYWTDMGGGDLLFKATGWGKLDEEGKAADYEYREVMTGRDLACHGRLEREAVKKAEAAPAAGAPKGSPPRRSTAPPTDTITP